MHGLKSLRIYKYNVIRTFSTNSSYLSEQKLRQAYFLLDLDDSATIDEVQERYSKLLLRLHPDTGGANADPERLARIRDAFKLIMKINSNDFVLEQQEEKDFGIKHIVPQHRQYLEFGGVGSGSPFTRQRQYQQHRVYNALENVREFTIEKTIRETQNPNDMNLIAVNEQKKRQKNRLTGVIERVVEDMILASMGAGEFNNLKGSGQPLKMDQSNPYIDQTEQRINRILRDNGFAPLWISKENELRKSLDDYRQKLCNELAFEIVLILDADGIDQTNFPDAFDEDRISRMFANKPFVEKDLNNINKLIQNYNLIAPSMDRQFMPLRRDLELKRAKQSVLADFPNSRFIIQAKKRLGDRKNYKEERKSHGLLNSLLNRFR